MQQEKTTIQAAAKALGVTTKTIQRYLSNGTLTKIKEGARTYILIDEIRTLRQGQTEGQKNPVPTSSRDRDSNTITVNLKDYTNLVQEVGHYKGMMEGQTRHLIEYKADIDQKNKELSETKEKVSAQNKILREAGEKIRELRAEVERLKIPWWRRLFMKKLDD
jgi:DNA-binding transcriptional MerR regulator